MPGTFDLEIITPDRMFYSGKVEMIIFRAPDGERGVLKDHLPMVSAVAIGPIRLLVEGIWREAVVGEGFMEITRERTVILTDTAEWPEEIDINRAIAARERARERLMRKLSQVEYLRSHAALSRALARLKVTKDR